MAKQIDGERRDAGDRGDQAASHVASKPIADAAQGGDRVTAELAAQRQDVRVERLGRAEPLGVPDLAHDPLAGHDASGIADQQRQQVELLRAQRELVAVAPRPARADIDRHRARPQRLRLRHRRVLGHPAQVGAHAGQQLREPERLDEVVVGAGVEAGDDVELLVARREDQDRQLGSRAAQSPADLDAVDVRQAEIEDHEVHGGVGGGGCAGAAGKPPDRQALALQDAREPGGDRVVVLHEQDHLASPYPGRQRCPAKFDRALTWRGAGADHAHLASCACSLACCRSRLCSLWSSAPAAVRRRPPARRDTRADGGQPGRRHPRQSGVRRLPGARGAVLGQGARGWSQTQQGGVVTFTDKLNSIWLAWGAAPRPAPSGAKVSTVKRVAGTRGTCNLRAAGNAGRRDRARRGPTRSSATSSPTAARTRSSR